MQSRSCSSGLLIERVDAVRMILIAPRWFRARSGSYHPEALMGSRRLHLVVGHTWQGRVLHLQQLKATPLSRAGAARQNGQFVCCDVNFGLSATWNQSTNQRQPSRAAPAGIFMQFWRTQSFLA